MKWVVGTSGRPSARREESSTPSTSSCAKWLLATSSSRSRTPASVHFGVARSYAYEAPKPDEFGSAGRNWEAIGWRADVEFHEVRTPFRPADWIERLRPLLPDRYAPLQRDGRGVQSIYL